MARSTRKIFLMIEKLFYAFRSILTFPLNGGRQGWGCSAFLFFLHPRIRSGAGSLSSPVEEEEIRFRK
jgi:hypothetical protein